MFISALRVMEQLRGTGAKATGGTSGDTGAVKLNARMIEYLTMNDKKDKLSVLVLEPYYGGSHKSFLKGLMRYLPHEFTLMEMPARKWKWRMRLAAQEMAGELKRLGERYDRVLCSTFVDVAALRSLGPSWLNDVPVLTYFHENQFAYPVQAEHERDMHFALTNMTSAMASDSLAFNSSYNLHSFLAGIRDMLRRAPDFSPRDPTDEIAHKSRVLSPGIDFSAIDSAPSSSNEDAPGKPVIIWNHRWEHDKGPDEFFKALFALDDEGADFALIVLGQAFERRPGIFDEARGRLGHRTLHFGHAPSREEYARLLRPGTLSVSTSTHEFFGISVLEAVRAGARPLLPRRLSYPELFPDKFLYEEGGLLKALRRELRRESMRHEKLPQAEAQGLTEPHSWGTMGGLYDEWISNAKRAPRERQKERQKSARG